MLKKYFLVLGALLAFGISNSQNEATAPAKYVGQLLDEQTKEPLAFAHVVVLGTKNGAVSNENGRFTITNISLKKEDTLSFFFVGYRAKKMSAAEFINQPTVYLGAETFSLNEFFVFADDKNAEDIVKMVLPNTGKNYKKTYTKEQVFTRDRNVADINHVEIKFKKSSFNQLSEKMTKLFEQRIPKQSISYTDFLGNVYSSNKEADTLKVAPVKVVKLKDKDITDFNQIEYVFEKMFKNTKEDEYWKVKSGVLGGKVHIDDQSESSQDSLVKFNTGNKDTYYTSKRLKNSLSTQFDDEKEWEFLHQTNRYRYELKFGTQINGEKVYVIDFTPKNRGDYEGRLFIAMETYALVKANFNYAEGKTGTNIKLFGIGYTENVAEISIYFEKRDNNYHLKYYASKSGSKFSFNRNLSLLKKRERFWIDKKLNEIKVKLNIKFSELNSFEMLVIESHAIAENTYNNYKPIQSIVPIYVNQFNDDLWKGYTVIEPSNQMREYKKME